MQIDWDEIQNLIGDELDIFAGIGETEEILVDKLGFSKEEAGELSIQMAEQVWDAEDQIRLDLAIDLTGFLANLVKERDKKHYPEDNPDQILLFDPTKYNEE